MTGFEEEEPCLCARQRDYSCVFVRNKGKGGRGGENWETQRGQERTAMALI